MSTIVAHRGAVPYSRIHACACAICSNAYRTTSEEKRYDERMAMEDPEVTYNHIRRAAEVHRQVRKYARKTIRPGMRMLDIAEMIETGLRNLVEEDGLESGVGFPTGLSLNHCAAHYSPNPGDTLGGCSACELGNGIAPSRGYAGSECLLIVLLTSAGGEGCPEGRFRGARQGTYFGFGVHAQLRPYLRQAFGSGQGSDRYGSPGKRFQGANYG